MITPSEAKKVNDQADMGKLAELEKQIDASLRAYDGYRPVTIAVSRGMTPKMRNEIERRYRSAGWSVEFRFDQRDGDYWEFGERPCRPQEYREG